MGSNAGSIGNSYSIGNVTGETIVGGLAGENAGSIVDSYSSGAVVGGTNNLVGGLLGSLLSGGTVMDSFWDTQTSGQFLSAGGTGETTAQLLSLSTYNNAGWSIGTDPNNYTWLIFDGQTRPMLAMEYSTVVNTPHALQLIGINSDTLGASYTLGNKI